MIESTTYMDSVEKNELVPQFTLSAFENPDDEWNFYEKLAILRRMNEQFNGRVSSSNERLACALFRLPHDQLESFLLAHGLEK